MLSRTNSGDKVLPDNSKNATMHTITDYRIPCSVSKQPFCNDEAKLWHIHNRYELVFFSMEQGGYQVGRHWRSVFGSEILLIAPNTPHYWLSKQNGASSEYCVSVLFDESLFGDNGAMLQYTPFVRIGRLLKCSGRCIQHTCAERFRKAFDRLLELDDLDRTLELIRLLDRLAAEEDIESICPSSTADRICESKRMTDVMHYISTHFKENITLKEIASVANMTPPAFCKYFKKSTGKTFVEFVNELRLHHACKLIFDTNYSISQICFESGFNSLTNFNSLFRRATSMSPVTYRTQALTPPREQLFAAI